MGTPNYPKDMAGEWQKLKRDVKQTFSSANFKKGIESIGTKIVEIFTGLTVNPGAFFRSIYANGIDSLFIGRHDDGDGNDVEGMYISRPNGSLVFWTFGNNTGQDGFWAFYDMAGNIILSDDVVSGQGLARPWLPYTFVRTALLTTPADTNSTTTFASHHTIVGYMQHPRMRLDGYLHVTGTATAIIRIIDPSTSAVVATSVAAGEGFFILQGDHPNYSFGNWFRYDIQIRVSSGTGTVGVTPIAITGIQSP